MVEQNRLADTGQIFIDEISGQKVSPVEQQIFDGQKSRVRLVFGLVVWLCAILLAILTWVILAVLLQIVDKAL